MMRGRFAEADDVIDSGRRRCGRSKIAETVPASTSSTAQDLAQRQALEIDHLKRLDPAAWRSAGLRDRPPRGCCIRSQSDREASSGFIAPARNHRLKLGLNHRIMISATYKMLRGRLSVRAAAHRQGNGPLHSLPSSIRTLPTSEAAAAPLDFRGTDAQRLSHRRLTMLLLVETELKPAGGIVCLVSPKTEKKVPLSRQLRPGCTSGAVSMGGDRGATVKSRFRSRAVQSPNDHPDQDERGFAGAVVTTWSWLLRRNIRKE